MHDCIIIGGGPAGLSAAIYLARFHRDVLVIDRGNGRWNYNQITENYLGFPQGIHARQLHQLGELQARKFGARFTFDDIKEIKKEMGDAHHPAGHETGDTSHDHSFILRGETRNYQARTIILATGVRDLFPRMPKLHEYVGKTLFWCITCEGYKTIGKRIVVVGHDDEAACTALQFLLYTPHITFVTNCSADNCEISAKWRMRLKDHHIPFIISKLADVEGEKGFLRIIHLENGQTIELDMLFNQQGALPNSELAKQLGITLDKHDYIEVDEEQRTNIPFVYAAGDNTRVFSHQVVTAAHEGSMAAQAANYDLYFPYQRMD